MGSRMSSVVRLTGAAVAAGVVAAAIAIPAVGGTGAMFVSASVNPDASLIACFALDFWLGARILVRGLTLRDGVALGAVTALAVLTKKRPQTEAAYGTIPCRTQSAKNRPTAK